ncbi:MULTISPECIES: hypothetical protein [unclassified Sphingopyxis]|uniref:hypothetical protein n=1 Tax=unclassified Sphingopyxis TaxID=2614943 RepID=UPI003FA72B63
MEAIKMLKILILPVLLSSCAHRETCGSISDYRSASVSDLTCHASSGNKLAQLELGIRYEYGDGVPRDLSHAEKLYVQAARSDRNGRYVYSPPVGNERYGRAIPAGESTNSPGLSEARERLLQLRSLRKSD